MGWSQPLTLDTAGYSVAGVPDLHQIYTNSALDRQNISPPVPKRTGGLIMFMYPLFSRDHKNSGRKFFRL